MNLITSICYLNLILSISIYLQYMIYCKITKKSYFLFKVHKVLNKGSNLRNIITLKNIFIYLCKIQILIKRGNNDFVHKMIILFNIIHICYAQIYKPSAWIFYTRKLDFLIIYAFLLVGEIFYPIGAIENL